MALAIFREVERKDLQELYNLINRYTGAAKKLELESLRRSLFEPIYEMQLDIKDQMKLSEKPYDMRCIIAQDGSRIVGFITFNYYYSPWVGRCTFVTDIYVEPEAREKGIAKGLVLELTELCKREHFKAVICEVSRLDSKYLATLKNYQFDVYRDDSTDWSIHRIVF